MAARIIFGVLLGAAIGMGIGLFGQRAGGTCPLLCNPYGGAVFGAIAGGLITSMLGTGARSYTPSPHLVSIESAQAFEEKVIKGQGPVVVEFYTARCPACRRLEPEIHALADRLASRATVAQVDAAALPAIAGRYAIQAVPTVLVFRDGKEVSRTLGYQQAEKLAALIESPPGSPGQ